MSVRLPVCLSSKGGSTERPERRGWVGAGGWALVDGGLVNGDGRKRACGMRTIPGDTEIRVVSDGDDDSNSSTMTTTIRTWARAGGVVRAGGGDARGMFCVVRLCDELRMQSQRQGRHKQRRFA